MIRPYDLTRRKSVIQQQKQQDGKEKAATDAKPWLVPKDHSAVAQKRYL